MTSRNMQMNRDLKKIRLDVLEMVFGAGEGHIPSAFSVIEILYTLYSGMQKADAFFLSKGHASAALYAVLAHFGHLDRKELSTFCQYDSRLGGHPHIRSGLIMNSSGSLGHGFPMAAGYALGKKIKKEEGRVFCLIGDGEANEGTIWETAMYADQLKLSNLVCIIDNNNSQVRAMVSANLGKKFESFGWLVKEADGHNPAELADLLFGEKAVSTSKPLCIVANTIKGRGVKEIENNPAWHHRAPADSELKLFKEELSQ